MPAPAPQPGRARAPRSACSVSPLPGAQERPELDLAAVALQRQVLLDLRVVAQPQPHPERVGVPAPHPPVGLAPHHGDQIGPEPQLLAQPAVELAAPDRRVERHERRQQERQHPPGRLGAGQRHQRQRQPGGERAPSASRSRGAVSERFGQSVSARSGGSLRPNGSGAAAPAPAPSRSSDPSGIAASVRRVVVPHVAGRQGLEGVRRRRVRQRPLQRRVRLRPPVGGLGHPLAVAQRVEDDPEEEQERQRPTGTRPRTRRSSRARTARDSPCSAAASPAGRGSAAGRRSGWRR